MKPLRTWVLIADASRARVLENLGPGKGLHQVPHTAEGWLLPPNREMETERRGRTMESQGATRHAIEPKSDPHRELKREFAQHLVGELERWHGEKAFDRLVLVGPPEFLGDMRGALPKSLAGSILAEVAKDLTRTPTSEVAQHLDGVMSF